MLAVKALNNYTIPMFGNKRVQPYGKLLVSDGTTDKLCNIKEDNSGTQYINFKHKRYEVANCGSLWSPRFKIIKYGEDV